jgi:hypothetical protein
VDRRVRDGKRETADGREIGRRQEIVKRET